LSYLCQFSWHAFKSTFFSLREKALSAGSKLVSAKFTPGTSARLHIALINASGFGLGEFVTIKFDVAGGSFLANASAFSVAGFAASDPTGTPPGGITATPMSVGAAAN
jgi:hypothetical protein